MELIDLRLFGAEETADEATTTTEETTANTEAQEETPSGLEGIDEETAREIMAQLPKEETDESAAEADSDTKQVSDSEQDVSNKSIPYARFKEVNDKSKTYAAENEQLKAELQRLKEQRQQQPPATTQATQAPVQTQQPPAEQQQQVRITPEFAATINNIAYQEALKMSGLTKEEVDVLEFADENDPKLQAWNAAKQFANTQTWNAVHREFENRRTQQAKVVETHQKVIGDYATFESEQMQQSDFEATKAHATGEYFNQLSPLEQQTLTDAWNRVERKVCSPQDVMVVKNYYIQAANDYRSKNAKQVQTTPEQTLKQKAEKLKQMERHPRAEQVTGSNALLNDEETRAEMEKMLEGDWDKIPPDVQQKLLRGYVLALWCPKGRIE